jgi:hypothetical protein
MTAPQNKVMLITMMAMPHPPISFPSQYIIAISTFFY